jgi:hypothetical protein
VSAKMLRTIEFILVLKMTEENVNNNIYMKNSKESRKEK